MNRTEQVVLAVALLVLTGCTKGSEPQAAGSCSTGPIGDRSIICIEYRTDKNIEEWRAACTMVMNGTWSEAACDTTTALGGCRTANGIVWLYPSEAHKTLEDARASCSGKGKEFIIPARKHA